MSDHPLPPPCDIGLPSRFTEWRAKQAQAVLSSIDSPKRFVVQNMPTGAGKSVVYMAQALLTGGRVAVLTSTKGLQQQLYRDFAATGLVEVRGQNSYPCRALAPGGPLAGTYDSGHQFKSDVPSVEEGPCHVGVRCPIKHQCDYFSAVDAARGAELVVTNYAFWMTIHAYTGQGLGDKDTEKTPGRPFDLLVLDEAHDAPDQLAGFLEVEVTNYEMQSLLHSRPLDAGTSASQWRDWAGYHSKRVKAEIDDITQQLKEAQQETGRIPGQLLRQSKQLKRLDRKLEMLAFMQGEWVTERQPTGILFSPVWPGPYAERFLFHRIPKVVLVSATIRPRTAHYLGIPAGDIDFREYPSTFHAARRPVIHVPTVRLNHRATDMDIRQWLARIDQIIKPRVGTKGIVHTVSYQRRTRIQQSSEFAGFMMIHASDNTRHVVERFKRAAPPAILVSPSMTTGWDFPHDECRWQIITKVPFPDTRGELMKARVASDELYAPYLAMLEMVQAAGRGMRAEDDWCETFIIDDNIGWFLWKYKELAPKWFLDSFRKSMTIPPPIAVPR